VSGKKFINTIKFLLKFSQKRRKKRTRMCIMLCKDNDTLISRPAIVLTTMLKISTKAKKDLKQRKEKKYNLLSFKDI
jgi:hypothetical protein